MLIPVQACRPKNLEPHCQRAWKKHQTNRTKDIWLVVSSTPLKNMKVTWDDYSQYMEKKQVPNHQSDISREFVLQS
jgi:hypothetical protein